MGRWRAALAAGGIAIAGVIVAAALLKFLAPALAYQIKDRSAEWLSGGRSRSFRIALGATGGSAYQLGTVLNRHLKAKAGYELELVSTASPGNVQALRNPNERIDLAMFSTADDEAAAADGVYGLAALETQYFFVVVPNDSAVQEFRDLAGAVHPGVREPGQPPTIGARVLEYYGMVGSRVSIVETRGNNVGMFDAGDIVAATRTQVLHAPLIENLLESGRFRLVPIRDHDALARSLPGTKAGFIPAGLYGPGRRIPAEPVPTITVRQLLAARGDVPGRVVRDILEVLYDPRFTREVQYEVSEAAGRDMGGLSVHPAADIYYHRNDLPTSDLLGRLTFVASGIAGLLAAVQFITRVRRGERVRQRRRLLGVELAKLDAIRQRIEDAPDATAADELLREADDLLSRAERDAAADLLDAEGIQSLRSLHEVCWRAHHSSRSATSGSTRIARRAGT